MNSTAMVHSELGESSSPEELRTDSVQNQLVDACKRRKHKIRYTPSLPKEIIFNILSFVPAQVLIDVMRFVCREWYDIVNDPTFIRAHLRLASCGILVQDAREHVVSYLETINGALKLRELTIPPRVLIRESCNGSLALIEYGKGGKFYVLNPLTKLKMTLPPLMVRGLVFYTCNTNFTYSSSGQYKVVYHWIKSECEVSLLVCTLGVDKSWRLIEHMRADKHIARVFCRGPYSIGGFLCWIDSDTLHGYALEVDSEIMHECHTTGYDPLVSYHDIICTEMGLGLTRYENNESLWEVLELMRVKSGEWTKVVDVEMEEVDRRLRELFHPRHYTSSCRPLLYSKKGELWLRCFVDKIWTVVCLNVKDGNVLLSPYEGADREFFTYHHVNNLLSLENPEA